MLCETLVANYLSKLKGGFFCLPAQNQRVRVVTPYLYPDHDRIELFIRDNGDGVAVSDLGETLRHLDTSGMDVMGNETRLFQAQRIAGGLDVELVDGILLKRGPMESVGALMFDVLAACKATADLIYGSRAYAPARFEDEVAEYLRVNDFEVDQHVPVVGQSNTHYNVNLQVHLPNHVAWIATLSPKSDKGVRGQINAVFRMWSDVNHNSWKHSLLNDTVYQFRDEDLYLLSRCSHITRWTSPDDLLAALRNGPPTTPLLH
jgi:hypothetical protein